MSEPDNFLARWSRRKRAAAAAEDAPQPANVEAEAKPEARPEAGTSAQLSAPLADSEFDLASLPPLDEIAADTDIRAFLKPGVPASLRDAALRRAWSADPAIRDFRGLQENDWDFNDPDAMSGFGKLAGEVDLRDMVKRVFGDIPDSTAVPLDTVAQAVPPAQNSGDVRDSGAAADLPLAEHEAVSLPAAHAETVQRDDGNAARQGDPNEIVADNRPRRHGGALPR
jgi:hypothetical protein